MWSTFLYNSGQLWILVLLLLLSLSTLLLSLLNVLDIRSVIISLHESLIQALGFMHSTVYMKCFRCDSRLEVLRCFTVYSLRYKLLRFDVNEAINYWRNLSRNAYSEYFVITSDLSQFDCSALLFIDMLCPLNR